MPEMPTITVTDRQAQLLIAEFADPATPGDLASAVAAYRAWLTSSLIRYVRGRLAQRISNEHAANLQASLAALDANLPPVPALPEHLR